MLKDTIKLYINDLELKLKIEYGGLMKENSESTMQDVEKMMQKYIERQEYMNVIQRLDEQIQMIKRQRTATKVIERVGQQTVSQSQDVTLGLAERIEHLEDQMIKIIQASDIDQKEVVRQENEENKQEMQSTFGRPFHTPILKIGIDQNVMKEFKEQAQEQEKNQQEISQHPQIQQKIMRQKQINAVNNNSEVKQLKEQFDKNILELQVKIKELCNQQESVDCQQNQMNKSIIALNDKLETQILVRVCKNEKDLQLMDKNVKLLKYQQMKQSQQKEHRYEQVAKDIKNLENELFEIKSQIKHNDQRLNDRFDYENENLRDQLYQISQEVKSMKKNDSGIGNNAIQTNLELFKTELINHVNDIYNPQLTLLTKDLQFIKDKLNHDMRNLNEENIALQRELERTQKLQRESTSKYLRSNSNETQNPTNSILITQNPPQPSIIMLDQQQTPTRNQIIQLQQIPFQSPVRYQTQKQVKRRFNSNQRNLLDKIEPWQSNSILLPEVQKTQRLKLSRDTKSFDLSNNITPVQFGNSAQTSRNVQYLKHTKKFMKELLKTVQMQQLASLDNHKVNDIQ